MKVSKTIIYFIFREGLQEKIIEVKFIDRVSWIINTENKRRNYNCILFRYQKVVILVVYIRYFDQILIQFSLINSDT
jgi:hypothetical protein